MDINPNQQIVSSSVSAQQALQLWKDFQDLKRALLDVSDYQVIYIYASGKGSVPHPFIKKSGWRKLATAFNVSCEIIKEERIEYPNMEYKEKDGKDVTTVFKPGFVYSMTAKATALNGRFMVGTGSCATNERKFAHLEHDCRSTAETRAKNRAISDLIGGGEVSAEEVDAARATKQNGCSADHDNLSLKRVTKGDNKGKTFVQCKYCTFFEWREESENDTRGDQ